MASHASFFLTDKIRPVFDQFGDAPKTFTLVLYGQLLQLVSAGFPGRLDVILREELHWNWFFRMALQGYLDHKKHTPPRTLQ